VRRREAANIETCGWNLYTLKCAWQAQPITGLFIRRHSPAAFTNRRAETTESRRERVCTQ